MQFIIPQERIGVGINRAVRTTGIAHVDNSGYIQWRRTIEICGRVTVDVLDLRAVSNAVSH